MKILKRDIIKLISSVVIAAFYIALISCIFVSCENDLMDLVEDDVLAAGPASTYSVSYDGNGATGGDVPVDLTEYESGDTVTVLGIGTLVKEEHEFLHWNTQSDDLGTSFTSGPTLTMGDSDVTLWAIWTQLPTYTVTFDSQGGSPVASQNVLDGGKVVEPADPDKEGYTFGGWFKEALCNNPWIFASDTVTADRTLYADWEANTYTVVFDSHGGTEPSPTAKVVTYGEAYGTLPTVTKRDYIFEGWWTGENGTGMQVTGSRVINTTAVAIADNHTLYAKWGWTDYNLRDLGPGQGWIFYINPDAETDGWKYLQASTGDLTARAWGTYGLSVNGADASEIGTGLQNTIDIVTGDSLSNKAADECADHSFEYSGYDYVDWYLPSKEELDLMYEELYLHGTGFFDGDYYWSSTEESSNTAWARNFADGSQTGSGKNSVLKVRAVRTY